MQLSQIGISSLIRIFNSHTFLFFGIEATDIIVICVVGKKAPDFPTTPPRVEYTFCACSASSYEIRYEREKIRMGEREREGKRKRKMVYSGENIITVTSYLVARHVPAVNSYSRPGNRYFIFPMKFHSVHAQRGEEKK